VRRDKARPNSLESAWSNLEAIAEGTTFEQVSGRKKNNYFFDVFPVGVLYPCQRTESSASHRGSGQKSSFAWEARGHEEGCSCGGFKLLQWGAWGPVVEEVKQPLHRM
jgi:hypothetical protein